MQYLRSSADGASSANSSTTAATCFRPAVKSSALTMCRYSAQCSSPAPFKTLRTPSRPSCLLTMPSTSAKVSNSSKGSCCWPSINVISITVDQTWRIVGDIIPRQPKSFSIIPAFGKQREIDVDDLGVEFSRQNLTDDFGERHRIVMNNPLKHIAAVLDPFAVQVGEKPFA